MRRSPRRWEGKPRAADRFDAEPGAAGDGGGVQAFRVDLLTQPPRLRSYVVMPGIEAGSFDS
ncbi:hypothetical protein GC170_05975 [bacterium]|nr:hypothetical protein [bacterium]